MSLDLSSGCAGSSAMYCISRAAAAGDLAEVQRLVGQDPRLLNAPDDFRWTPLMDAAEGGYVGVVRWLLDQGARLNEQSAYGSTALCLAGFRGHTPMVRLLLERGADPTIVDVYGLSPLIRACDGGRVETVLCLLEHPSAAGTINHRDGGGATALWWACAQGRVDAVRVLLERGADPSTPDIIGKTPLVMAQDSHHPACVEALKVRCFSLRSPLVC
jgi:uncharacterized protein